MNALAELQRQFLAAVTGEDAGALAPRVRPGGVLVYSVCSFTHEEGTGQLAAFLHAHPDFVEDQTIRCELPADHTWHRNGERTWTP